MTHQNLFWKALETVLSHLKMCNSRRLWERKKLRVLLKPSKLIFEELVAVSREETEPKNQRGQQNKTKTNKAKAAYRVRENSQCTDLPVGFFCFIPAGYDCSSVSYNGKSCNLLTFILCLCKVTRLFQTFLFGRGREIFRYVCSTDY